VSEPLTYTFSDIDLENKKFFSHIFPELSMSNKSYYKPYISYKGLKVYASFRVDFECECRLQIKLVKARQDIPQGIDVGIHNARLKFPYENRETKNSFIFIYDYSYGPAETKTPIELYCTPIKFRNKEKQQQKKWLMIYNIWEMKRSDGRIERCSWGGDHGVVIEQKKQNEYRLYFSCGEVDHQNITFQDLVIDVAIEGEYTPRFQCGEIFPLNSIVRL